MAYAEKRSGLWRARWRDPDGRLRSASGFASREDAVWYGQQREAGLRPGRAAITRIAAATGVPAADVRKVLLHIFTGQP